MEKINDYDKVDGFTGESQRLPAGGYIAKILKAECQTSKSGKKMLVLFLDIADGEFKNYFKSRYEVAKKLNKDAKWSSGAIYRQLYEGNSLPFFKGLITSIEKSNEGYKWDWNEEGLKDKLVGAIFGEEEYLRNDGNIGTAIKIQSVRSTDCIIENKFKVPEVKKLKTEDSSSPFNFDTAEGDDLPF